MNHRALPLGVTLVAPFALTLTAASSAQAGVVADENKYTGDASAWTISDDGTAAAAGVVDVYPARWSVRAGESVALKVRSTTGYTARVFRLGYYGGGGAKPVAEKTGTADPQPYPSTATDDYKKFGLMHAGWSDSVTFDTTGWVPGLYWARVEQSGTGKQAATVFVVRESGDKWPILVLLPFNTEQAYNAWPGAARGGKSLYAWNSSPGYPTDSIGIAQAVKVSFDRPFLVGAGTADFTNYEYPGVRWLERMGYDAAYASDMDVEADPTILAGRKAIVLVGHSEYWTRKGFDAALAARNGGVSLLSLSGDTLNWQVRYEDGFKTLVGYKESADNACPRDIDGCVEKKPDGTCAFPLGQCKPEWFKSQTKDPEAVAGREALAAGNVEEAKKHLEVVTTHWNTLYNDAKIDLRRPGLYLTGVQTAGIVQRPGAWGFPWCDYLPVGSRTWWLWDGVTCDRIPGLGGYEIDSAATADKYYDAWRPVAGRDGISISQRRIAALVQAWDGKTRGSAAYYRHSSGAEVVALSAMAFTWGLDDYAGRQNGTPGTENACAQRMVKNALDRWSAGATAPPVFGDAGVDDVGPEEKGDAGTEPVADAGPDRPDAAGPDGPDGDLNEPEAGTDASLGGNNLQTEASSNSCSCSTAGSAAAGTSALAAAGTLLGVLLRRRRRRSGR